MSFSRVTKLLEANPSHKHYQPLSADKNEKIESALVSSAAFTAHAEQQEKILEYFGNKLNKGDTAFNNLESEMKAICDQSDIMEHIRINDIFFNSGNADSLKVAQNEMEQHPTLLLGYVHFHNYLNNVKNYKEEIEKCLATKPGIKDDTIQELYKKLNNQYQAFKKTHNFDETLAKYTRYDKKVNEIIEYCKQNSEPVMSAAAYRPRM